MEAKNPKVEKEDLEVQEAMEVQGEMVVQEAKSLDENAQDVVINSLRAVLVDQEDPEVQEDPEEIHMHQEVHLIQPI